MGGKVNSQLPFMCGRCKKTFQSERAVTDHINASHTTELVGVYKRVNLIDHRDKEPSYADREIEARLAIAMGEPTDDAWLLGE
jgi:uncharacterized C2H2 Zn-finger protein